MNKEGAHEKLAAMAKIVDLHLNMYFIDNALEVHQIVVLGYIAIICHVVITGTGVYQ